MGGLKSRTFAVPVVLGMMYLSSLTTMAVIVAAAQPAAPGGEAVTAGLLSGVAGVGGLACFYRALSIGTMSIVAPVASTGVSLPVIVGLAGGDDPSVMRAVGLAVAVVGVVLASREAPASGSETLDARRRRASIVLALLAGIGFGSYFVGAEVASRDGVAWALLLSRMSAAPLALAAAVFALRRLGPAGRPAGAQIAVLAGMGVLDLGANALYNHATTVGELSSVSVAGSLYPVVTVLLAAAVLGERVRGVQRTGVVVALAGVLLIAAGA